VPRTLHVPCTLHVPRSRLDLTGVGLQGTLPSSWGLMTGLRSLALGTNAIAGPLPPTMAGLDALTYVGAGATQFGRCLLRMGVCVVLSV
jgi:hypothetical protein